eukprot:NODE_3856_length_516_cov_16.961456_g3286_i0.p3 GENE.NODE_3856_length_516_cov_16.961456_g3286_i0~~NODE_3856_length_516_cov_16.961456_g3286_i0.p3  ORF type:complete len:71 (+),score=10.08 NODE_3856_length_516_cov_16.961456_g3286_i0:156-368(+)
MHPRHDGLAVGNARVLGHPTPTPRHMHAPLVCAGVCAVWAGLAVQMTMQGVRGPWCAQTGDPFFRIQILL